MTRRIIRIFAWTLAVLALLVAGLYVYLRSADLSVYQAQIEGLVSRQIGHELRVDGRFELQVGATTVLVAEDASLVNPDWPGDGELIRVGHLTFAFDTWSIFSRTFLVEELRARDISGSLLRNESGAVNWVSERIDRPPSDGTPPDLNRVAFHRVDIEGIEFLYESASRPRPVLALIEVIAISPDENGILDLDLRGNVNELPLWADGKIGPWRNFINGKDIFADLDVTLGQGSLSLEGTAADVVRLEGVQLDGVLSGPAIERVLERLGVPQFSSGAYQVTAEVRQQNVGHLVRLNGDFGQVKVVAGGSTDSILAPSSVNYDFSIAGPSAGDVARLAGIDGVPAEPFQVTGEYSRDDHLIGFDDALLRVGENAIRFGAELDVASLDLDILVSADGPDFSVIGPFVEVDGLPSVPFTMRGRLQRNGNQWQAEGIDARVGDNRLVVNGRLETSSNLESRIALQADGPDISILQDFTDLQGIPQRPFDIDVVVRSHPDGILVEEGTGLFGDNRIDAQGTIVLQAGLDGTAGSVRLSGPELQNVALVTGLPYLPAGPFDISGDVAVQGDLLRLDGLVASVGELRGKASGTVAIAGDEPGGFDLDIELAGPDLATLLEVEELDVLAGDPFRVAGDLSFAGGQLTASGLEVSVGNLDATLNGAMVGAAEQLQASVTANAEDSAVLRKLTNLAYLPVGPVAINGEIEKLDEAIRFTDAIASVGDYRVMADGKLSLTPRSNNSDLSFSVTGPSLSEAGQVFGFTALPMRDFAISGDFNGTPSGFEMRNFLARVGNSDLHGEFEASLEGKPGVTGNLTSTYLDLRGRLRPTAITDEAETQSAAARPADRDRLFSAKPLDTSWLQQANIDIKISVDELITNAVRVTDVDVALMLLDGRLRVDPFFLRQGDGSIEGSFSLAPEDGRYRLLSRLEVDQVRAGVRVPGDDDLTSLPPVSGSLRFEGVGDSVRSIMASSNGSLSFRQGAGKVREIFGSAMFRDVFMEVLRTLNPLRESRNFRLLECGIYAVSIEEGLATIDRFVIQTEAMTTVARGEINLRNERLDLAFRAKPREGLGISLGTVANELLELRGTLKSPAIRLDAGRAATATGAAVATGGLSLLARGLWDRLSAEGDICEQEPEQD